MAFECNNKPVEISSVYVDNNIAGDKTTWIINDDELLVPKEQLELGDMLSVTYNTPISGSNEVMMLSTLHDNLYKTLDAELEFEFVKKDTKYPQNIELISRAVNRWDKTFIVDEYYSFGLQEGRIYFSKTSYHDEGDDSFPYKQLLNLANGDRDSSLFFKDFPEEIVDALELDKDTRQLKYNTKYQLKAVMKENTASFYIKEVSSSVSQAIDFKWLPLFEDLDLNVKFDDISNRNVTMDSVISAPEPVHALNEAGMYGLAFPNSFARIYRYEVTPFDKETQVRHYNDTEYSKNVATDFSMTYRNDNVIKLNSSDSTKDNTETILEYFEVEDKKVTVPDNIQREDLQFVQLNNVEQKKDIEYEDRFIDVKSSMTIAHEGSAMLTNIDKDDKDVLGQQDEYFFLGEGDGIVTEFDIPDEAIQKLSLYPNARIGAVIVEVPDSIKLNDFTTVGLQENIDEFFTTQEILKQYKGRSIYMETVFRGEQDTFQMGIISEDKLKFNIDNEFLQPNDSYESVWLYNMANFVNDFGVLNPIISDAKVNDLIVPDALQNINKEYLNLEDNWIHEETVGYVVARTDHEDLVILSKSPLNPNFLLSDTNIPEDIQELISKGLPIDNIRALLRLFQNTARIVAYTEFILEISRKSYDFRSFYADIAVGFNISGGNENNPGGTPSQYITFRETWLDYLVSNMHSSNDDLVDRSVYSDYILNEEVYIDFNEKKVSFNEVIDFNKKVSLRIYYDNVVELTDRYKTTDTIYNVSDGIKELYSSTEGEKGPDEMIESFDPSTYKEIKQGNIAYVVVPNNLIRQDQELFADITLCSPFIEADDNVKRHEKLPLRKVSDLLQSEFSTSQGGLEYLPEEYPISGSLPVDDTIAEDYNRPFDYTDELNEFVEGKWDQFSLGIYSQPISGSLEEEYPYDMDFPKVYPVPDFANFDIDPLYERNIPELYSVSEFQRNETYFVSLFDSTVDITLIDRYLDVSRWLNTDENRLSDFNKSVLRDIVSVMSKNRTHGNQQPLSVTADPFDINNWFDGFYSGELSPWGDTWHVETPHSTADPVIVPEPVIVDNTLDFGRMSGSPWGTENSRKQMIDQLANAGQNRFEDYTLFYIDLSKLVDYNKTVLTGINSNAVDPEVYPISGISQFIDNPFISPFIKDYIPYEIVYNTDGQILFSPDNFSRFTDIESEYPSETRTSYPQLKDIAYEINQILRPITSGIDLDWTFNNSIMFATDWQIPEGTFVNAEFEYVYNTNKVADNSVFKIAQKVTLGKAKGLLNETFPNPHVIYNDDVKKAQVHKVWLDNYRPPVEDYDLVKTSEDSVDVEFTNEHVNDNFDVALSYTSSNFLDLKVKNEFVDNFDDTRDMKWVTLTKNPHGYVKQSNIYGMVTDNLKIYGETIWRKSTITKTVEGDDIFTTSGTANSKETLYGLQRGLSQEDTIELIDFDKTNNFEFKTDIYFNDKSLKDFMTTGIIFRGAFNYVDETRYFNEYYSIIIGSNKYNIGLVMNATNKDGITESQELATVNDANAILKRNTWYTLRFTVVKDIVKVYFNVRNQKEKFYFEYDLNKGRIENSSEYIVDDILPTGLGVNYQEPKAIIKGSKMGLSVRSDQIYFSNVNVTGLEENNLTMNDSFRVNKLDEVIASLKNTYKLEQGKFKKLRKTIDGYTYLLIDNSLFAKKGDGTYIIHSLFVDDFEIHDRYIYVVERARLGRTPIINIYLKLFELVNDVKVNGKAFINEPMLSYIKDFDREVSGIEKNGDDIFLTFDNNQRASTWAEFFDQLWSESDQYPWIEQ